MSTENTDDPKTPGSDQAPGSKPDKDSAGDQATQTPPQPGPTKIPEEPGNLRRREEWYRKRS